MRPSLCYSLLSIPVMSITMTDHGKPFLQTDIKILVLILRKINCLTKAGILSFSVSSFNRFIETIQIHVIKWKTTPDIWSKHLWMFYYLKWFLYKLMGLWHKAIIQYWVKTCYPIARYRECPPTSEIMIPTIFKISLFNQYWKL